MDTAVRSSYGPGIFNLFGFGTVMALGRAVGVGALFSGLCGIQLLVEKFGVLQI